MKFIAIDKIDSVLDYKQITTDNDQVKIRLRKHPIIRIIEPISSINCRTLHRSSSVKMNRKLSNKLKRLSEPNFYNKKLNITKGLNSVAKFPDDAFNDNKLSKIMINQSNNSSSSTLFSDELNLTINTPPDTPNRYISFNDSEDFIDTSIQINCANLNDNKNKENKRFFIPNLVDKLGYFNKGDERNDVLKPLKLVNKCEHNIESLHVRDAL